MWDGLDKTAKAFLWCPNDGTEMDGGFEPSYAYTEADELEDALLFPLEASGELVDNLFRNDPSAMEVFEKETIDVRKFAADLDTDDERMDSDDDLDSEDDFDSELDDEALEALEALEDDDGDSNWGTDEELSESGGGFITADEHRAIDKTVDMLADQMKKFRMREPDYFLPILRDPSGAKGIPDVVKNDPTNLMHALRNALRHQKEYDSSHFGIEADFLRHLDRQKSKGMCSHAKVTTDVADR